MLARATPLRAKRKAPRAKRASKLPPAPKRSVRGPERHPEFLTFVRSFPCLYCRRRPAGEAHHWGKRGKGMKCSDLLTVPLCHEHHVEGWHRHGTLPGRTRAEWLDLFERASKRLLELFVKKQEIA